VDVFPSSGTTDPSSRSRSRHSVLSAGAGTESKARGYGRTSAGRPRSVPDNSPPSAAIA